jgi:hypothetical protein
MVKSPGAGAQSLLHRVQTVQYLHRVFSVLFTIIAKRPYSDGPGPLAG